MEIRLYGIDTEAVWASVCTVQYEISLLPIQSLYCTVCRANVGYGHSHTSRRLKWTAAMLSNSSNNQNRGARDFSRLSRVSRKFKKSNADGREISKIEEIAWMTWIWAHCRYTIFSFVTALGEGTNSIYAIRVEYIGRVYWSIGSICWFN